MSLEGSQFSPIQEKIIKEILANNENDQALGNQILENQIDKIYQADIISADGTRTNPILDLLKANNVPVARYRNAAEILRYRYSFLAQKKRNMYLNLMKRPEGISAEEATLAAIAKEGETLDEETINMRLNFILAVKEQKLPASELAWLFRNKINTETFDYLLHRKDLSKESSAYIQTIYDCYDDSRNSTFLSVKASVEEGPPLERPKALSATTKPNLQESLLQENIIRILKSEPDNVRFIMSMQGDRILANKGQILTGVALALIEAESSELFSWIEGAMTNIDNAMSYYNSSAAQEHRIAIAAKLRIGLTITEQEKAAYDLAPIEVEAPKFIPPEGVKEIFTLPLELSLIQEAIIAAHENEDKDLVTAILYLQMDKIYQAPRLADGTNPIFNRLKEAGLEEEIKGYEIASDLACYKYSLLAQTKREVIKHTISDFSPDGYIVGAFHASPEKGPEISLPESIKKAAAIKTSESLEALEKELLMLAQNDFEQLAKVIAMHADRIYAEDIINEDGTFTNPLLTRVAIALAENNSYLSDTEIAMDRSALQRYQASYSARQKREKIAAGELEVSDEERDIYILASGFPEINVPQKFSEAAHLNLPPALNAMLKNMLELVHRGEHIKLKRMIEMHADTIFSPYEFIEEDDYINPLLARVAIALAENGGDVAYIESIINLTEDKKHTYALNAAKIRTIIAKTYAAHKLEMRSAPRPDSTDVEILQLGFSEDKFELEIIKQAIILDRDKNVPLFESKVLLEQIDKIYQLDTIDENGVITNPFIDEIEQNTNVNVERYKNASTLLRYAKSLEAQRKREIYLECIALPEFIDKEDEILARKNNPTEEIVNMRINLMNAAREGNLEKCITILNLFWFKVNLETFNYLITLDPVSKHIEVEDERLQKLKDASPAMLEMAIQEQVDVLSGIRASVTKGDPIAVPKSLSEISNLEINNFPTKLLDKMIELATAGNNWYKLSAIIDMHADRIFDQDVSTSNGFANPILSRIALIMVQRGNNITQLDEIMNKSSIQRYKASLAAQQMRADIAAGEGRRSPFYSLATDQGPELFVPKELLPNGIPPSTENETAFMAAIKQNDIKEVSDFLSNPLISLHLDLLNYALKNINLPHKSKIQYLIQKAQKTAQEHWTNWSKEVVAAINKENNLKELDALLQAPLVARYISRNNNQLLVEAVKAKNKAAVTKLLEFGRVKSAEVDQRFQKTSRGRALAEAKKLEDPEIQTLIEEATESLATALKPELAMEALSEGEGLAIKLLKRKYEAKLYADIEQVAIDEKDLPEEYENYDQYLAALKSQFVEETLKKMVEFFRKKYNEDPIIIVTKTGERITLPFDLDPQYKQYEEAYYSNGNNGIYQKGEYQIYRDEKKQLHDTGRRIHSAKRYFDVPNPLMDETAQYVGRYHEGGPGFAYNVFEQREQMALMYYAALNPPLHPDWDPENNNQKYIDERYKQEEDVLDELIMIFDDLNRGHNNDEDRDANKGTDRPTCGDGVAKRIAQSLQSILGIPPLTETFLIAAFRSEVIKSKNVIDKINEIEDIEELKNLHKILKDDLGACLTPLEELDEELQKKFELFIHKEDIKNFVEKYRTLYTDPDTQASLFDMPELVTCKTFIEKGKCSAMQVVQHMQSVYFNFFSDILAELIQKRIKDLEPGVREKIEEGVQGALSIHMPEEPEAASSPPAPATPTYLRQQREEKERYGRERKVQEAGKRVGSQSPRTKGPRDKR